MPVPSFLGRKLGIVAAQVEINARHRLVERKPDSTQAKHGVKPSFRANEKNILELVPRMERMIHWISRMIRDGAPAKSKASSPSSGG